MSYLKHFLPEIYPLVSVADTGVFYQCSKNHEKAHKQIYVDGLHVRDLGQGGVDRVDEGGHGEDRGDPQPHPGGGGASVEPEGDPGHHHYQAARDVDLGGGK